MTMTTRLAVAVLAAALLAPGAGAAPTREDRLPRAMPSDYATAPRVLPRVMPSDYARAGIALTPQAGMPRAMPADYDAYFASQREPRGGFDWPSAGIGAGIALGAVLAAALAVALIRRNLRVTTREGGMKRRRNRILAAMGITAMSALLATALVVVMPALATPQSGQTATQVSKGRFGAINVKAMGDDWRAKIKTKGASDVYVTRNIFAAGGQSGWHTHPGPSLITVTSGEITAYDGDDPTCTATVYRAGEGFVDPGGSHVHLLRNETAAPAETVAVQIIPTDAPRRIDAPNPGNCSF